MQEIKNKLQNANKQDPEQTVGSSREKEDGLYPKEPEIETNQKISYGY